MRRRVGRVRRRVGRVRRRVGRVPVEGSSQDDNFDTIGKFFLATLLRLEFLSGCPPSFFVLQNDFHE